MPGLCFYRDPEEAEKEEQAAAEKAVTLEQRRGERMLQLPSSLPLTPRSQTSLKAPRCPLCLPGGSLLKTAEFRPLVGEAQPLSGPKLFFQRLLNRKWK